MSIPTITYYEDDTIIEKCSHNFKVVTGLLTFATYESDGVAFSLSNSIPTKLHFIEFSASGGYVLKYDYANLKIKIFVSGTEAGRLAELANSTVLSGATVSTARFLAIGV